MSAKWLKWTIAIASVAAGTAAIIGKVASDKKKEAELDDFLLPEEEESEFESRPSLTKDIQSWQDMDAETFNVEIAFQFDNEDNAFDFQEWLAKEGLSSQYEAQEGIVQVVYSEDTTMEGLNFLAATLEDACVECQAKYQGFHFL